jgi:phenylacetate-CoA ligase
MVALNPLLLLTLLARRHTIRQRDRWTRERLMEHQTQALKELREYAYARSPFYQQFHRGLMDVPLQDLPVLTKKTLMEQWDAVVTDRSIQLAEVRHFLDHLREPELFRGAYYVAATGGTSGLRGIFLYDQAEWTTVLLSYSRANDWAGLHVGVLNPLKIAVVTTTVPWHESSLVGATLKNPFVPSVRIDSTEPLPAKVARLNEFQPRALIAYPREAKALAEEQRAGRLDISPEAVFCAAEVLTRDTAELIARAWGVVPFNVYGSTETAGIASECADHCGLHLYEDLLIVEVVDKDNQPVPIGEYGYKVLATVLFSRTLPLIRYEISDSVCLSPRNSGCGLPFRLIGDVQGRAEEILFMADRTGAQVPVQPIFFHRILEPAKIRGWQVVQQEGNRIVVLISSPEPDFHEDELVRALASELERMGVSEPQVEIRYVESFERTSIGKTYLIRALK